MKKIFKYNVRFTDMTDVEMPVGAEILTANQQMKSLENINSLDAGLKVWAIVDDEETRMETRRFRIAGTGHPLGDLNLKYITTVFLWEGKQVYHIFEIL